MKKWQNRIHKRTNPTAPRRVYLYNTCSCQTSELYRYFLSSERLWPPSSSVYPKSKQIQTQVQGSWFRQQESWTPAVALPLISSVTSDKSLSLSMSECPISKIRWFTFPHTIQKMQSKCITGLNVRAKTVTPRRKHRKKKSSWCWIRNGFLDTPKAQLIKEKSDKLNSQNSKLLCFKRHR